MDKSIINIVDDMISKIETIEKDLENIKNNVKGEDSAVHSTVSSIEEKLKKIE
ncbi:hypothetical protein [Clostridium cylindrosporum]|uniref:Uncharacterized protein n=1 Tax=Clostridium cylindrosporum DSM 605 TaxID=1121307 RepID=A0A0J8D9X3_CLOCY|nr:hypothetical protein [Clostridium cylindrosporum]KMT22642.1 hypothetical protein CLCY_9c00730 [Clostridium cylindrosporum DSM 605]